jgi:c-di-GMP-binding flagellar brake protein YcgR
VLGFKVVNRIYNLIITHMNSWPGIGAKKARERKYPRVKVSIPAEARHVMENFPRRGQTTNLSEGGCYIEMVQTLEPPTCVDVVLWLNDQKIQARAEVVTRNAHLGNGIRFLRISDADKEKLRNFVEMAQKSHGLPFRGPARLGPAAE